MGNVFDVDAARRDIGRDQQVDGGGARLLHHAIALVLRHAAVQGLDGVTAANQPLRQFVDLKPGAAEDDRQRWTLKVEHATERGDLVRSRNDVGGLAHLGHRALLRGVARNENADGILEVALGDSGDARRKGRGEQRGLARFRCGFENELEILCESHVEHLIRFVEHNGNNATQVDGAATHVVEHAAWSRDHYMGAAPQRHGLAMKVLSAVDRRNGNSKSAAIAMESLGNLHCQLAGGNKHKNERLVRRGAHLAHALQER